MDETVVYHSPLKVTPKRRLERIIAGILYALRQRHPLLSIEETRTLLGLLLLSSKTALVHQALTMLETTG